MKKILFVDNDPSVTSFVKSKLEATGSYEVRTENNPLKAVEAAQAFQPQLIFLDVMMPGMEGPEVAKTIRSNNSLKEIPIVFMTGVVTVKEVGITGGVVAGQYFFPKPARIDNLIKCIEKNLGS